MKKNTFALMFLFLTVLFAAFDNSVSAQNQNAEFPATTLGEIAKEWIVLINNGSEEGMRRFVEVRHSGQMLKEVKLEDIVKSYRKIQEQSGGLEVLNVTPPKGEFPMSILAKSKRGNNFVVITLGEAGGKILGLGLDRAFDPAEKTLADKFPQKLSEAQMVEAIKARIAELSAQNRFSGVIVLAKDDKILLRDAYGIANRETSEKINFDTKFHLASVGKMFTAVSVAQLVKAGKISYQDPVSKFLPDFPNEAVKKVTIHQLLTHSAGMGTFFESPGFTRGKIYQNSTDEIQVYKDEKLRFEPGDRWRYSNAGYSLLGAIIERVTGKTYLEYIRENIFKKLDLKDKTFGEKSKKPTNVSVLYRQSEDDPLGIEPYIPTPEPFDSFSTGFGGGYMGALDLLKFARAYRTGKLLGARETAELISGKIDETKGGTTRWGYGIKERQMNGEIIRGHSGGGRTDVQMIWDKGYTLIVQINAGPPPVTIISNEILQFITKQIQLQK